MFSFSKLSKITSFTYEILHIGHQYQMNWPVNNYLQNFTFFHTCMVSQRVFVYIFQCLTSKNVYLRMLRTRTDSNFILWNSWSDLYCKFILLKWFYFWKLKLSFKTKFLTMQFSVHFESGLKNLENSLFLIFSTALGVVL